MDALVTISSPGVIVSGRSILSTVTYPSAPRNWHYFSVAALCHHDKHPRINVPKATDIYKRLLLENRDDLALNVYVAMCYYKLDYYDVSLEILAVYLQAFPDSAVAMNLKVRARERESDAGIQ